LLRCRGSLRVDGVVGAAGVCAVRSRGTPWLVQMTLERDRAASNDADGAIHLEWEAATGELARLQAAFPPGRPIRARLVFHPGQHDRARPVMLRARG
jgi:hypothetical protein